MDILRRAKIIHVEGTFKACTKNMIQVFTIHAYVYDKSIMKKAFSIEIKPLYRIESYKNLLGQLGALAFIPINKIAEALLIIRNNLPKNEQNKDCSLCICVLDYFMVQWMQSYFFFLQSMIKNSFNLRIF